MVNRFVYVVVVCLREDLILFVEPLKLALVVEAQAWKTAYGHSLNSRYRASMNTIVHFVTEYSKRLSRPIKVCVIETCILPTALTE